MVPCKSEGDFAIKFSSSKVWQALRENKRRGGLLSAAVLREHVACGLSQSALVPLAAPADARLQGVPGAGTASACSLFIQCLFPAHPCPARAGAWDVCQRKAQAGSPSVAIISEGVRCHAEKGSCCPSCRASRLPQQLERFWHPQGNAQHLLASAF